MLKNVASQVVCFQMSSASDLSTAVTSGTPTVYYTIDGGTQGTGGGTATHEGNGVWSYVPAQAETNGDNVAFTMVLSTAAIQTINLYPREVVIIPRIAANVTSSAGSAVNLSIWCEDENGARVDLSGFSTKAAALTVTEVQSDADLFTESFVAGDIAKNAFNKQKASPGYTADRSYVYQLTVTLDGTAYTNNEVITTFG